MPDQRRRLVLFTRYPVAGRVKTRLIPALGASGAASLHRRLVLRTLRTTQAACRGLPIDLEIRFDGGDEPAFRHWLGFYGLCRPQQGADLGERMANAFQDSFREGATATIIIGTDCPELSSDIMAAGFDELSRVPAVFGPANDGGYYLIGLSRMLPELFQGIAWGTDSVLAESRRILADSGVTPALLERLDDLDRPDDLHLWQRIAVRENADLTRISVIVPALNEASHIVQTLAAASLANPHELLVVDGGSTDATRELASQAGATVLTSFPGRARQMNFGAARAAGNILLFLHADTILPPSWPQTVVRVLQQPRVAAGAFAFAISESFTGKRFIEWTTNLRSRWFRMPYGDQAFFLRRSLFEEMGGFGDLPIMEDYEFVQRLRKVGSVVTTSDSVMTSGRRWRRLGLVRTTLTNQLVVAGFQLGVSPHRLARLYRG